MRPTAVHIQRPAWHWARVPFELATIVPAEFNFPETISGSLEVGKVADFQIIEGNYLDPAAIPDEEIDAIKPLMTIVADEVVWTSDRAPQAFKNLPHFYGRNYLGPNKVPGTQARN